MVTEEDMKRLVRDPAFQQRMNDPIFICDVQAVRCELIHDRIEALVRPLAEAAQLTDPSMEVIHVVLLRIVAWLRTLKKLKEIADFQASASAARFMFETSVDLTLLVHDPKATLDRMNAWFDSHKLKLSEGLNGETTIPASVERILRSYEASSRSRVEVLRQTYFDGRHPGHWRTPNWAESARKADNVKPAGQYIGFLEFYRTRYAELCFYVHSGVAGVARMPQSFFPGVVLLSLRDVADLALLNAELVLRYLKKWDDSTAKKLTEGTGNGEATLAFLQREAQQQPSR